MKRKRINKYKPCWAGNYFAFEGSLSQKLIGQGEAVSEVASILAAYKNRPVGADFPAQRVLLIGPPSSGKTYLAESAVHFLNVPTVHVNMSSISPPGYRGFDVGMAVKSLIESRGHRRAERSSAIVMDEIDKVVRRGGDEFMRQIEFSLLPILNGERILIDDDGYGQNATSFSSKNSIVFLMGVFPTINPKIWSDPESSKKALVKYGFSTELVSRLTHFIYLNPLKRGDFKKLIEREVATHSVLYQSEGFIPTLTPLEVDRAVNLARSSDFGIRGMRVNINQILHCKAVRASLSTVGAR